MNTIKLLSIFCLVNTVQLAACDTKQHTRECLQQQVTERYQLTRLETRELDECVNRLNVFIALYKVLNNEGKWEELLNNPNMLETIWGGSTCQNLLNKIQNRFAIEEEQQKKRKKKLFDLRLENPEFEINERQHHGCLHQR